MLNPEWKIQEKEKITKPLKSNHAFTKLMQN